MRRPLRILFLSHYFPPEVNAPAARTFEHCRAWQAAGHQVTVVTNVPNHPHGRIYDGYRNRLWQTETRDGVRVVRVLTLAAANAGVVRRTLNYVFYLVMVTLAAPFLARTDVVVSTSPQFFNGLAGYLVSRLKRAPWVLEIRDLWPESILAVGAITRPRIIRMLEALERFAYRKADQVVSVAEGFVAHITARGGRAGRITVIRNGADLERFGPLARDDALAARFGVSGRFVAAYVGTHGMAHGLETVLEAAQRLADEPGIAFLLVGDGAEKAALSKKRAALGLDNVIMLDQQPREAMPGIWSVTDVCLVLLRGLDLFRTVIPSKIFEAMASARPLVMSAQTEGNGIVEAAGAGISVAPEDPAALADAVVALYRDRARCRAMGEAGRRHVQAHFDRRRLAAQFAGVLETAVAGRRRGGSG